MNPTRSEAQSEATDQASNPHPVTSGEQTVDKSEAISVGDSGQRGLSVRADIGTPLAWALAYASRGWPVFPVHTPREGSCSCGLPLGKEAGQCQAKHPRLPPPGHNAATTDAAQIAEWWTQWPDANIGVPTGARSGFFVVDLDIGENKNGADRWAELLDLHGGEGEPLEIRTGSGGTHLLYRHVDGVTTSRGSLPRGIDIRGDGGYIVAPPSLHWSGARYEWKTTTTQLADAPSWLLSIVRARVLPDAPPARIEGSHTLTREDLEAFIAYKAKYPDAAAQVRVARSVLDGSSWAPAHTTRRQDMISFLGAIRMFVATKHGATLDADSSSVLFDACTASVTRDGVGNQTDRHWVADLIRDLSPSDAAYLGKLEAARAQKKAERLASLPSKDLELPEVASAPTRTPEQTKRLERADLTKLATKLSRRESEKSKEAARLLKAVAGGECWSTDPQGVDNALESMCFRLAKEHPDLDPDVAARLFAESADLVNRIAGMPRVFDDAHVSSVLRDKVTQLRERAAESKLGRVEIPLHAWNRTRVVSVAADALAAHPDVYRASGKLSEICIEERKDGIPHPYIRALPPPTLGLYLGQAAAFVDSDDKPSRGDVPADVVAVVESTPKLWGKVRVLDGLVMSPVLRPDGTVLQEPGYDARTGLFLYTAPGLCFPGVPDAPSEQEAREAVKDLLHLLDHFPFAARGHKSVWLSLVLSLLALPAIKMQRAPMHLFDATVKGSGKTLLVTLASLIVSGEEANTRVWGASEEEQRKAITTMAIAGDKVLLLDNLKHDLEGAPLEAALTGKWNDRQLGGHEQSPPLYGVFAGTGNNIRVGGDMGRRALKGRLIPDDVDPSKRKGLPDVKRYVVENRGKLLAAGLTILRGYFAANRPPQTIETVGSYESWSAIVASAIVWAGEPDPSQFLVDRLVGEIVDEEAAAATVLVESVYIRSNAGAQAVRAASLVPEPASFRSDGHRADPIEVRLAEALPVLAHGRGKGVEGLPTAHHMGVILRKYVGRVYETKLGLIRLRPPIVDGTNIATWSAERVAGTTPT